MALDVEKMFREGKSLDDVIAEVGRVQEEVKKEEKLRKEKENKLKMKKEKEKEAKERLLNAYVDYIDIAVTTLSEEEKKVLKTRLLNTSYFNTIMYLLSWL